MVECRRFATTYKYFNNLTLSNMMADNWSEAETIAFLQEINIFVKTYPRNNSKQTPLNPFSTTRRYKRHQNKVKVKGLGRNNSYLAAFSIFFMVL